MRKTFELVAETGPEQVDLDPLFATLDADATNAVDGALDAATMLLEDEPSSVIRDLKSVQSSHSA